MMQIKNKFKKTIKYIGFVVLFIVFYRTDWSALSNALKNINLLYLIPVYLLIIPKDLLRVLRWHYFSGKININRKYWANFKLYFVGILAGVITPGRVGEFYKVVRLSKEGHSKIKSTFLVVVDRLFDVILILILGAGAIYFFISSEITGMKNIGILLSILIVLIISFLLMIFKFGNQTANIAEKVVNKLFNIKLDESRTAEILSSLNLVTLLKIFLLTVLFWLIYFYQLYMIAGILGINLPFIDMLFVFSFVSMVSALPISFIGLGTREFTMIKLLSIYGIAAEKSLALSLMTYTIIMVNMILASYLWYGEHKKYE